MLSSSSDESTRNVPYWGRGEESLLSAPGLRVRVRKGIQNLGQYIEWDGIHILCTRYILYACRLVQAESNTSCHIRKLTLFSVDRPSNVVRVFYDPLSIRYRTFLGFFQSDVCFSILTIGP